MKRMPTKMILCILTLSLLMPNVASLGSGENISFGQEKKVEVKESDYYIKEIPLTKEQQKYTAKVCEIYEIDIELMYALMEKESNFKIDAISETRDFGVCQINESNFKWIEKDLGKDLKFLTFNDNVLAGAYVLSTYLKAWEDKYSEDERKHLIYALNSYNMGCTAYKNYISRGNGYNTRLYAKDIMEYYRKFLLGDFSDLENN